jgi:hypothetical protein
MGEQRQDESRIKPNMTSAHEKPPLNGGALRDPALHPAWAAFIRYCAELDQGEIERLCIQDGLPVLAELTQKKIRFPPG